MKNINTIFLVILIIIIIIMFSRYLLKSNKNILSYHEGFTQNEKYLSKFNEDIYDDFYVSIYDELHDTMNIVDYEYDELIKTVPFNYNSKLLDIGSGTGYFLNVLSNNDINAVGLEKSTSMKNNSENLYPNIYVINGDANDPKTFDRTSFSHITMLSFTFYEFEEQYNLIKNCFFWLQNNGYLIIHLVDKDKYNPLIAASNPFSNMNPQQFTSERIKKSRIDFGDFNYLNQVDFKNDNRISIKETFTDNLTQNVRENELTIYVSPLQKTLNMIINTGFIAKGKFNFKNDPHQFVYIFTKAV